MIAKRNNPDYAQLLTYVPKWLIVRFKTFCAAQQLEQSQVVETLLQQWVSQQEQQNPTTTTQTQPIPQLDEEAIMFLKKLGTGQRPNTIERAALAHSLEIDVEILDKIVDCIFESQPGVNHGS